MIEDSIGSVLRDHNEKIVQCILLLKEQRDDLAYIIDKQYEERKKLETEMERIAYKLCLINRSLGQRLHAKSSYDKTLTEIEEKYNQLVQKSSELLMHVEKEFEQLDSMINKKTNTEDTQNEEESGVCCEHCEKACKMSKEHRRCSFGSPKKVPQSVIVEVETPTKLEKTDNGSSNVSSNNSSGGNQDADDEEETRSETTEIKRDDSDEEAHSYTLEFQKHP